MNSISIYNDKPSKGGIRVSTLVATITSFVFVSVLVSQLLSAVEPLPLLSLVFLIFTMAMLSVLLFVGDRSKNGIGIFFYILFLIYYGFSYINLTFFEGNFHRGNETLIGNLNEAVLISYVTLFFTITLCVVFILAFRGKNGISNKSTVFLLKNPIRAVRIAVFLSIFAIFMHHYAFVFLGVGRYAGWVENTALFRYIYFIFIDKDIYFILTMGLVIASWGLLGRYEKILFTVLVLVYISQALFFGSKAGIFWTAIYSIGLLLFIRGDFKIKYKVLMIVGVVVLFLLPLSYGIGMVFRSLQNVSEYAGEIVTISDIIDHALLVMNDRGSEIFNFENMFRSIFARISAFDSFVVVLDYGLSPYLASNVVGGVINTLLPGVYFENSLPASQIYAVVYLDSTLKDALENYHTEIYYIFGAFIPYFGVILGLMVSVFLIVTLFNVYDRLHTLFSSRKIYYMAFFMYLFTWLFVYMGIEEFLFMLTSGVLHLFIFIFIVEYFSNKKRIENHIFSIYFK